MRTTRTPLQRALRDQGRRQNWLAAQIGKHESEVSRIANGYVPDAETQRAIADALGLTVAELFSPQVAA